MAADASRGGDAVAGESEVGVRATTAHHYNALTLEEAGMCTVNATGGASLTRLVPSGVLVREDYTNNKPLLYFSEKIPGSSDVLAVVAADALGQLRQDFQDESGSSYLWYTYCIEPCRTGNVIVRYSTRTGAVRWISGTGYVGKADGLATAAEWSADVSALAFHPTCSINQAAGGTDAGQCPAYARPELFQRDQFVYVADAGNCRITLVDYGNGEATTKWGSRGCTNSSADYADEPIADRVVLGSHLSIAWVGYKFLLVVDGDAHRIRKYVTSQHQGLSNLAGNGTCGGTDGDGAEASLCNPSHVAVTPDGSRAIVAERLLDSGAATFHRLRVLDLVYTYLPGGDIADVTASVRTLSYEPIEGTYNLFSPKGGMRFSPDGLHLVAGATTEGVPHLEYDSTTCTSPCSSHSLAIFTLQSNASEDGNSTGPVFGELKLVRFANKELVKDATVTSVESSTIEANPQDEWWNPGALSFTITLGRHSFERKYEFSTTWLYYDVPSTVLETITVTADSISALDCWTAVRDDPSTRAIDPLAQPSEAPAPVLSRRSLPGAKGKRGGGEGLIDPAHMRELLLGEEGTAGEVGVVGAEGEVRLLDLAAVRALLSTI